MTSEIDFVRKTIKGKIAEQIFEFMFRNAGEYTVIPFGYEYSQPEIAQNLKLLEEKEILSTLRNTPDFILINKAKTEVYFVEVKYMKEKNSKRIKEYAQKIVEKWNHTFLFVATPEGFFYEPCNTIIQNNGEIGELYESHVPKDLQSKYLQLLKDFEK